MELWNIAAKEKYLDGDSQWEEELVAVNIFPSKLTEKTHGNDREILFEIYLASKLHFFSITENVAKRVSFENNLEESDYGCRSEEICSTVY